MNSMQKLFENSLVRKSALACVALLFALSFGLRSFAEEGFRRPLDLPSGGVSVEEVEYELSELLLGFGREFEGTSFYVCFNRSLEMTGIYDTARAEICVLLEQLSSSAKFNLIGFGVDNELWKPQPVQGLTARSSAIEWTETVAKECMSGSLQLRPAMDQISQWVASETQPCVILVTAPMHYCNNEEAMSEAELIVGNYPQGVAIHVVEYGAIAGTSFFADYLAQLSGGVASAIVPMSCP